MAYTCAICMEDYASIYDNNNNECLFQFCNKKHIFCRKCFHEYVNKIHKDNPNMHIYENIPCPYCRKNINVEYLYAINGKKDGLNISYYKSGRLHEEVYYKDGYIGDGPYKKYYNIGESGENLWISYTYKNKNIDGFYIENWPNGNLKRKSFYINGKLNGYECSYYDNNILEYECYYIDGGYEGFCKFYYKNGKIQRVCTYVNGKKNGLNEQYNKDGILIKKEFYKNGIKIDDFYLG